MPGVEGTWVDVSAALAPAVLLLLQRAPGCERMAAALAHDLSHCGGMQAPFAALWQRPAPLPPLLFLATVHGCSEQVGRCLSGLQLWGLVLASSGLC